MPSTSITEYRVAREAQDLRFEAWARGGIAAGDTGTQEYRDYFGTGDCRGTGVEQRLTLRLWLDMERSDTEQRWLAESHRAGALLFLSNAYPSNDEWDDACAGLDEREFTRGFTSMVGAS